MRNSARVGGRDLFLAEKIRRPDERKCDKFYVNIIPSINLGFQKNHIGGKYG